MVRFQDTAGSLSRRRAQTWRDLFIAPCASLRPRWMTFLNILHDPGFNTLKHNGGLDVLQQYAQAKGPSLFTICLGFRPSG